MVILGLEVDGGKRMKGKREMCIFTCNINGGEKKGREGGEMMRWWKEGNRTESETHLVEPRGTHTKQEHTHTSKKAADTPQTVTHTHTE